MADHHRHHAHSTFILLFTAAALLISSIAFVAVRFGGVAGSVLNRAGSSLLRGCGCVGAGSGSSMASVITLAALVIGLAAIAVLLVRFLVLFNRTRRFIPFVAIVPTSAELTELAAAAGMAAQVREYDDERSAVFCAGLFKPLIYVPSSIVRTLDRSALRAVLEHERYHVLRRDPLRLLLADLVRILPGFKPIVDEYRGNVELAADEEAIERMNGNTALGRALIHLLSLRKPSFRTGGTTVAYFDATERRIDHLLGIASPPKRSRRTLCVAASVIIAALITIFGVRFPVTAAHAIEPSSGQCVMPPSCRMPAAPRTTAPWVRSTVTLLSTQLQ